MKRTAPVWSMRPKLIKIPAENIPGPGSYSPTSSTMPSSPNYRVGTSKRTEISASSLTPGPGAYSVNKSIDTPSWSFYGKSARLNTKTSIPAPSAYKFNQDSDSPKYSTSKNLWKSFEIAPNAPGVGNNNMNMPLLKGNNNNLFGKTSKNYFARISTGPGPGDYEIHPVKDAPSFTFRPKTIFRGKDKVPGPGEYNPNFEVIREKSPSWAVRGRDEGGRPENVPGPGTYKIVTDGSGPKWKFGNSTRKGTIKSENPGPGAYEIKPLVGAVPSYVQL